RERLQMIGEAGAPCKGKGAACSTRRAESFRTPPLTSTTCPSGVLGLTDVRRLQSLRTPRHVELDGIALGESLETIALDSGEVHEHIFAVGWRDETETLRLVEPLYGATSHWKLLLYLGPRTRTCRVSRRGCVRSL